MALQKLAPFHVRPPISDAASVRAAEAEGWPLDLPDSTYELIRRSAERYGSAPALSFFLQVEGHQRPQTVSYAELFANVTRTANLLHRLGVRAETPVALVLPNLLETHYALWGGEAAGVALPINPLLEPPAIADILKASGARVVVTVAPFPGVDLFDKVADAVSMASAVTEVVLVELGRHVAGWRRPLARFAERRLRNRLNVLRSGVRVTPFHQSMIRERGDALESGRRIRPEETASWFCTGGTTGAPKLARHTHANEVADAWMSTRMLGDAYPPGHVAFSGLPLFHVNGAIVTGVGAFLGGAHVLMGTPQGFRGPGLVKRFWEIAAHHRVESFSGVPTLFAALLQQPTEGHDLSALKFAICGAAPMSAELIHQFEQTTGITILEGYGMTEATCVVSVNPLAGERRVGSVGLTLPFQQAKIVVRGPDGACEAAPGEVGHVVLRGPNVFPGYVSAAQNADVWATLNGERWLDTGDLGRFDVEGYLWLSGRAKDLIIRGGHNLDPAMIEEAFFAHPAVALAAAIGRPDPHAGEVPVVYIQLKDGESASEAELLEFAESRIHERAARPKAVHIIEALPLTAVGKVFKPALREMEAARDG